MLATYTYPCPYSDLFYITIEEPKIGEEIGRCPRCVLSTSSSSTKEFKIYHFAS
ncbi:hypothetical protein Golob_005807 [Gossypium lobatum]|uniref:DPH-type MB domain-containing protein n=1 Tax=Gossypium lobatum TaxID=34289 RepID=A0A7J8MUL4_9ROSI|nr:hypothetical protein [Gossypium lobatum]